MNRKTLSGDRRRRRLITTLWLLGLLLLISVLIYKELTAVLYILATLGVTALLLVVAFSNLSKRDDSGERSSDASGIAK